MAGSGAQGRARRRLATTGTQALPPGIQGSARDAERFPGGHKPMLLPEAQNPKTLLGVGTDHAPTQSTIGHRKKALYPISNPPDLHSSILLSECRMFLASVRRSLVTSSPPHRWWWAGRPSGRTRLRKALLIGGVGIQIAAGWAVALQHRAGRGQEFRLQRFRHGL